MLLSSAAFGETAVENPADEAAEAVNGAAALDSDQLIMTVNGRQILKADIPVPQKVVGVISSLRPTQEETPIEGALMRPENILMHKKIKERLVETAVPLLAQVVEEGIAGGVFACDNIPERIRMLMIVSSEIFDSGRFTPRDVTVFIDMTEKLLGAKAGAMGFIRELIQ